MNNADMKSLTFRMPHFTSEPFYGTGQQNSIAHNPQGQQPEPPQPPATPYYGQNQYQQNFTAHNHQGQQPEPPQPSATPYYGQNQYQQNFTGHSHFVGGSSPVYPQVMPTDPMGVEGLNYFQHPFPQGAGQTASHNWQEMQRIQLLEQEQAQAAQVSRLREQLLRAQANHQRLLANISQQQHWQGSPIQAIPILYTQDQLLAQREARISQLERAVFATRRGFENLPYNAQQRQLEQRPSIQEPTPILYSRNCSFPHSSITQQVQATDRGYFQAKQENRVQQNFNDDNASDYPLTGSRITPATRAPMTQDFITRGWACSLSGIEVNAEVYTGGDIGFPSAIGTLPHIMKVVPTDRPDVQNLFFVPYYDLKRPNEEPYISLENLGQVKRIDGQSLPYQEGVGYQLDRDLGRIADIRLSRVNTGVEPAVIVGLVQFITGIPVKAIDIFKDDAKPLWLCTIWIDYDAIDYNALNLSKDEPNLESIVKSIVISALTDNLVWMGSTKETNGVLIARDNASKEYLCNFLQDKGIHGSSRGHYPRHPINAEEWLPPTAKRALQDRKPLITASSVAGGGAAASPAVAGGGAAATPVGGRRRSAKRVSWVE